MANWGSPILVTLFAWWFSTGAILYLDGLPRKTYRWSMAGASILALAALWGLVAGSETGGATGAYLAFGCALALWGWNEMAFLFGLVTGPNREPCPQGATGHARFVAASRAILHHEAALVATAALIAALTWGASNQIGLFTFLLLFAFRLSTKLNIFLGVSNTTVEFLPPHLAYLKSYFRVAPMNLLFPLSVTAATLCAALLAAAAAGATDPLVATGLTLLATLAVLGVIEHWFLVVPLPVGRLWSWGLASHRAEAQGSEPGAGVPLWRARQPQGKPPQAESFVPAAPPLPSPWPRHVSDAGGTR